MVDVSGWNRDPQRRNPGEPLLENGGIPSSQVHPVGEFAQLNPADRGLHLGHAPVGPKGIVEPPKPGWMILPVDLVVALAMVLVGPGHLPDGLIVGEQHPALTLHSRGFGI